MSNKYSNYIQKHDSAIRLLARFVVAYSIFIIVSLILVRFARNAWGHDTHSLDSVLLNSINNFSTHLLNVTMPIMTDIGSPLVVLLMTLVFAALFVYKNERYRALVLLVSVPGALLANLILKTVFARERPNLITQLVHETGYSFPSGHAMASAVLAIALVAVLWNSRWRWWGVVASSCFVIFIGYSRLYLGVHYPSDILAGWMLSAGWVVIVVALLKSKLASVVLRRFYKNKL